MIGRENDSMSELDAYFLLSLTTLTWYEAVRFYWWVWIDPIPEECYEINYR